MKKQSLYYPFTYGYILTGVLFNFSARIFKIGAFAPGYNVVLSLLPVLAFNGNSTELLPELSSKLDEL